METETNVTLSPASTTSALPAETPTPPARRQTFGSLRAVRRELSRVYGQVKRGELVDDRRARTMIYALSAIAFCIRTEEELRLEPMIAALEDRLDLLTGGRN